MRGVSVDLELEAAARARFEEEMKTKQQQKDIRTQRRFNELRNERKSQERVEFVLRHVLVGVLTAAMVMHIICCGVRMAHPPPFANPLLEQFLQVGISFAPNRYAEIRNGFASVLRLVSWCGNTVVAFFRRE